MDVSHTQLSRTRDEYLGQHGILKRSKGLLRTITWQQKSETILLWCGLVLFILTASYVAQKRVLYFVPEALRPMALIKTTYRIIRGGTGSEILANKSNNKVGSGSGGQPSPAAGRRKKESNQRPPPAPAPKVVRKPKRAPEAVPQPVEVGEKVEIEAVQEPETPPVSVEAEIVKDTPEPQGGGEDSLEGDITSSNDDVVPNVHVEL